MKNILKFAFCLFFIVGLVPNLMGCNKLVKQIAKFVKPVAAVVKPVAAVEEPVAAVEEPVAAVEEPVAAVEEPVAAVEEPVAQITLDHRHQIDAAKKVRQTLSSEEANSRNFAFTEAKRVTIARAFYDHGVKNNQLAGGTNIHSVADISSVVYPLIENLTSISDKKSEAYLRKDAYRAAFRDLLVGEEDLNTDLQYLNALGLSTDDKAFTNPVTMPNPIRPDRTLNKYFSNWTGNDDAKLETLISREIFHKTQASSNMNLDDQDKRNSDVLEGGIFYKITKDPNGNIIKTIDDSPKMKTYNEVFNTAYNPQNMFSGGPDKRQKLMDIYEDYVNNAIDPDTGVHLFKDNKYKDNLKEASPLRQYYKVRDAFVDPALATEDLVSNQNAKIKALKTEDTSELSDPVDKLNTENMIIMLNNGLGDAEELNIKVTGEALGKLWDKEKIIAAMTALLPENQKDADIKIYKKTWPR